MFQSHAIKVVAFVACIISIAFVLTYIYRANASYGAPELLSGATVIEKAGKHMLLPTSTPSVAFVTDINLLKQRSSLFNKAKNGDAVIIYPEKVIVYDPKEDKIIDISAREVEKNKTTASPKPANAP